MNRDVDLLFRAILRKLDREVVEQIWSKYSKATADLFLKQDNAQ